MANKTKQALRVDNNQSFPNNNSGFITPEKLRTFQQDIIDSFVNNDDSGSLTTDTGSLLITASEAPTGIDFTKGDGSTFNVAVTAAATNTGSLLQTASFNQYTQSTDNRLDTIELFTASADQRFTQIEQETSSLQTDVDDLDSALNSFSTAVNTFTSSADNRLNNLEITTSSLEGRVSSIENTTSSLETKFDTLASTTSSLNTFTSSADNRLDNIENNTGSYARTDTTNQFQETQTLEQDLIVEGNLYVSGAEVIISSSELVVGDRIIEVNANKVIGDAGIYAFDAIGDQTGSLIWNPNLDYWLAGLSGSEEKVLVSSDTGSIQNSITQLDLFTQSAGGRLDNIEQTTASADLRLDSIETFTSSQEELNGTFATTGSNTFAGQQTINYSQPRLDLGSFDDQKDTTLIRQYINNPTNAGQGGFFSIINDDDPNGNGFTSLQHNGQGGENGGYLFLNSVAAIYRRNGNVVLPQITEFQDDVILISNATISGSLTQNLTSGQMIVGGDDNFSTTIPSSSFVKTQGLQEIDGDLTITVPQGFPGDLGDGNLIVSGGLTVNGGTTLNNTFTSSLTEGFVLVGDSNNITTEIPTGSFATTASLNTFTASLNTFTASLNTFTASLNSFTSSQEDLNTTFATTGSNTFTATQTISGSTTYEVVDNTIVSQTASIDFSATSIQTITLVNGSTTHLLPTNVDKGQTTNLLIKQPSVGSGSIEFSPQFLQATGSEYEPTPSENAEDILTFITFDDETKIYVSNITEFV